MTAVLVTGMSGTGKSTALAELARRGHRVVDTDYGDWSEEVPHPQRGSERLWREDRIRALLAEPADGALFVSGTVANQGRFYPLFDAIVLLSVPEDVLLDRVASRSTNDFGKTDAERALILGDLHAVEPLLRAGATAEIDTRRPVDEVADLLESIAGVSRALPHQLPERRVRRGSGRSRGRAAASERKSPWSSIAARRCSIASAVRPARLSQHATLYRSLALSGSAAISSGPRSATSAYAPAS